MKDYHSLKISAEDMGNEVGHTLKSKDEGVEIDGELQCGHCRKSWKKVEDMLKKGSETSLMRDLNKNQFNVRRSASRKWSAIFLIGMQLGP